MAAAAACGMLGATLPSPLTGRTWRRFSRMVARSCTQNGYTHLVAADTYECMRYSSVGVQKAGSPRWWSAAAGIQHIQMFGMI
jgi:hypothetical protein